MERKMSTQVPWPKKGDKVWVVITHHTWDAHLNNTYSPGLRKVLSVGTDTVHLEGETDRKLTEVYPTEELCQENCPAAHADH
jgi:hypothetical protein